MNKVLQVVNPNNLPTMPYTEFIDFQGDLKHPMTPDALQNMRKSLEKHGVFVPKFVWLNDGKALILDGHQTKQGLAAMEVDGWKIPPIPYVVVEANSREDAAEKLLQINSRYAEINAETTWLESFDFGDIHALLESIEIPEFKNVVLPDIGETTIEDETSSPKELLTQCPKCGFQWKK